MELEVKEGVILDREGNEISRPVSQNQWHASKIKVWKMGPLGLLLTPIVLGLVLAFGILFASLALVGWFLISVARLFIGNRRPT